MRNPKKIMQLHILYFSFLTQLANELKKGLKRVLLISLFFLLLSHVAESRPPHNKNIPQARKLRIFVPNFHPEVTRSFALCCKELGYTLIVPGHTCFPTNISLGVRVDQNYLEKTQLAQTNAIEILEGKTLFKNPPDIVIALGPHQLIFKKIWKPLQRHSRKEVMFVIFTGNQSELVGMPRQLLKNVLVTDQGSYSYAKMKKVPHLLYWTPWIDFENSLQPSESDSFTSLGSYINCYRVRFPNAADLYESMTQNFENANLKYSFKQYEKASREHVLKAMKQSCATIHIKPTEGFGYSIVESMAIGRPVFLYKPYSHGMRYRDWSIEGETAFYFSSQEEFNYKLKAYLENHELAKEMQRRCAKKIRELFNNQDNLKKLDSFFRNLRPMH